MGNHSVLCGRRSGEFALTKWHLSRLRNGMECRIKHIPQPAKADSHEGSVPVVVEDRRSVCRNNEKRIIKLTRQPGCIRLLRNYEVFYAYFEWCGSLRRVTDTVRVMVCPRESQTWRKHLSQEVPYVQASDATQTRAWAQKMEESSWKEKVWCMANQGQMYKEEAVTCSIKCYKFRKRRNHDQDWELTIVLFLQ